MSIYLNLNDESGMCTARPYLDLFSDSGRDLWPAINEAQDPYSRTSYDIS